MNLLNPSQLLAIRNAIKDVTDTFARTPVTFYQVVGVDDMFNEDRLEKFAVTWNLNALVEYNDNISDVAKEDTSGTYDKDSVKLTFNVDDLVVLGAVIPSPSLDGTYDSAIKTETDYFVLKGDLYRIKDVMMDGPLEPREVLLIIQGEKTQTPANFQPIPIPIPTP